MSINCLALLVSRCPRSHAARICGSRVDFVCPPPPPPMTKFQVPPAKRVKLVQRDTPPVDLSITLDRPGLYTMYLAASKHWTGSGVCEDPSAQPIKIETLTIPDSLFADERKVRCSQVCRWNVGGITVCVNAQVHDLNEALSSLLMLILMLLLMLLLN